MLERILSFNLEKGQGNFEKIQEDVLNIK
ncbi:hypothetical protein C5S42_01010 [Candidatus Methanomarinus sp.]|nr:hypothetical protein C5S42_01010 [ANME-2 cluster archaeon]